MTLSSSYKNPVYRGDAPDPSVIRVGPSDFWATTTSTEWAPQFPLLHSKDLVHWKHTGAVFPQTPQWATGKFWAPEISHYNGTFYVYYVAQHRDGPLTIGVATSPSAQGPYTDHPPLIGQTSGSIDPTPVTADGRRYLIWKEDGNSAGLPTTIWIQQLTADGLALAGEAQRILANDAAWEGHVVEAPSVIKHGGYYYLFYSGNACCGRDCKYAVGVARARCVMGPWEKHAGNPILKSNAHWRCPGHGCAVDTADGRVFYLYHAYAKRDSIFVGRQTLLDEITWDVSGWPVINGGKGPSSVAQRPVQHAATFARRLLPRETAGAWQWPHAHPPRMVFRRGLKRGGVLLGPPSSDAPVDTLACVLARSPHFADYVAETVVECDKLSAGTEAGIAAYGDRKNAVGITYQNGVLRVWKRTRGKHVVLEELSVEPRSHMPLRIRARRGYYFTFEARLSSGWVSLRDAPLRAAHLPPWDRGVRVALTAGAMQEAQAAFRYLRIRKTPVKGTPLAIIVRALTDGIRDRLAAPIIGELGRAGAHPQNQVA